MTSNRYVLTLFDVISGDIDQLHFLQILIHSTDLELVEDNCPDSIFCISYQDLYHFLLNNNDVYSFYIKLNLA